MLEAFSRKQNTYIYIYIIHNVCRYHAPYNTHIHVRLIIMCVFIIHISYMRIFQVTLHNTYIYKHIIA